MEATLSWVLIATGTQPDDECMLVVDGPAQVLSAALEKVLARVVAVAP
jgi:hypothetical protein